MGVGRLASCSSCLSGAPSSKLAKRRKRLFWNSGLINLTTSLGHPVDEPNQTTRERRHLTSSSGMSKMGEAGLQYSGSIEPESRVLPMLRPSVIVHHLGSVSHLRKRADSVSGVRRRGAPAGAMGGAAGAARTSCAAA